MKLNYFIVVLGLLITAKQAECSLGTPAPASAQYDDNLPWPLLPSPRAFENAYYQALSPTSDQGHTHDYLLEPALAPAIPAPLAVQLPALTDEWRLLFQTPSPTGDPIVFFDASTSVAAGPARLNEDEELAVLQLPPYPAAESRDATSAETTSSETSRIKTWDDDFILDLCINLEAMATPESPVISMTKIYSDVTEILGIKYKNVKISTVPSCINRIFHNKRPDVAPELSDRLKTVISALQLRAKSIPHKLTVPFQWDSDNDATVCRELERIADETRHDKTNTMKIYERVAATLGTTSEAIKRRIFRIVNEPEKFDPELARRIAAASNILGRKSYKRKRDSGADPEANSDSGNPSKKVKN